MSSLDPPRLKKFTPSAEGGGGMEGITFEPRNSTTKRADRGGGGGSGNEGIVQARSTQTKKPKIAGCCCLVGPTKRHGSQQKA